MKIIKHLFPLLFFILIGLAPISLKASHLMGGEITYKWLGNKKYELTMKAYRDCRGMPLDSPLVEMFAANGANKVTVNYTRTSIVDLTVMCSDTISPRCNPANTMSGQGVEEHTFKAIIDFATAPYKSFVDSSYCEIYIKMEQCCRNGAITNINPGNFYVESMMNICNSNFANSSPEFFNIGSIKIPCNQPFRSNFGGSDVIDNDSLTYELINPMTAHNTNETYKGNFNKTIFMTPYCPPNPGVLNCRALPNSKPPRGLFFDVRNADFVITPTNCSETAVMCIKVTEYRKINGTWKKLGHIIRDIQLTVYISPNENVVPEIIADDEYVFTTRKKTCFDISSFDTVNWSTKAGNKGDVTKIKLLNAPNGSDFKYLDSNSRNKTGRFCWTPHDSDFLQLQNISKKIPLTIEVIDNYCQLPSISRKTVFIKLLAPDSAGYLRAHTFIDRNKDLVQNQGERNLPAKLLVNYRNNNFSLETDTAGIFANSFGHGNYRIGPASHPYLYSLKGDTSIQIKMDSSYSLEFPIYKKNGIYGHIYEDRNNNCIFDSFDLAISGVKVFTDSGRVIGISDGEGLYYLAVPALGIYQVYTDYKTYEYKVNCPSGNLLTVNYSSDSLYENNNFGISSNQDFTDIQVSLNLSRIRRGRSSNMKVYCNNKGNETFKNISLILPVPEGMDITDSNTLIAKGGTSVIIQIDSILPKENKLFTLYFYVHPDSFKANDLICFTVKTDSICINNDSVKRNNTYQICRVVDAPYDPNEKSNSGSLYKTKFDNFIDYTVYFQNTGTDTAFRVMVTDTIDTRYLDPADFELLWSDAPCVPYISGNVLYFVFDEIRLPQLATAGDGSISGFGFRMGLKSEHAKEISFENRASIFFDFEDAVVTKPAVTHIISPVSIISMSKNSLCQFEKNQINFKSNIAIHPGNEFILELSEIDGIFDKPLVLASKSSSSVTDSLSFVIPPGLSGNYFIRIRTTEPQSISIPESGQIQFKALTNPNFLINSNINNYQLCQNDTLILDFVGLQYLYKVYRNDVALSNYSSEKSYRFKLNAMDKFMVIAIDSSNACTDTNRIQLNILPAPNIGLLQNNAHAQYCPGDSVSLQASGGIEYAFYRDDQIVRSFSQDDHSAQVLLKTSHYWVKGIGGNGCHSYSDSILIHVNPMPVKPYISSDNLNNLYVQYYPRINWYLNDLLIADTGTTITDAVSGKYVVEVQNQFSCKNESDPYIHYHTSTESIESGEELFRIYPNPVTNKLYIGHNTQDKFTVTIYNLSGQIVYKNEFDKSEVEIQFTGISSGLYNVQISDSKGRITNTLIGIME